MRTWTLRAAWRPIGVIAVAAAVLIAPATAFAQFGPPQEHQTSAAIGEKYHVEASFNFWNPDLLGTISSEQFGLIGTDISLTKDLGYNRTRFHEFRFVLRPAKKHRFRIEYMPMVYTAQSSLKRNLVFNGIVFPVSVPVKSEFDWKVWRLGYEYDFVYKSRGFVGVLLESRMTELSAKLDSPIASEFTRAKGPLPALGVVARGYVHPTTAINFEWSGMRIPDIDPKYQANYYDWNLYGTVNFTNYVGFQMGWRKSITQLTIDRDSGDLKFQGLWFGGVVRY